MWILVPVSYGRIAFGDHLAQHFIGHKTGHGRIKDISNCYIVLYVLQMILSALSILCITDTVSSKSTVHVGDIVNADSTVLDTVNVNCGVLETLSILIVLFITRCQKLGIVIQKYWLHKRHCLLRTLYIKGTVTATNTSYHRHCQTGNRYYH